MKETEGSLAPVEEPPGGEFESKEYATEPRPEIEQLTIGLLKPAVKYDSIADAIQDILKAQDITALHLRQKKKKSKRNQYRRAYDADEMTKIKGVVSENLCRGLENVRDSLAYRRKASEILLTVYRVHLRTLYWHR